MPDPGTEALRTQLEESDDLLRSLPGVVGWGVGVGTDGEPTIQVFFSEPPSRGVIRQLRKVFDRLAVVTQHGTAEAQ